MKPLKNHPIILFDGYCNLCNISVQFIIKHDKKRHFLLASLQSDAATKILLQLNVESFKDYNSIVLVEDGKLYIKSTAVLRIAKRLKGFVQTLYLLIIIPTPLRNIFYDFIAKNRYKWFGKRKNCMMPNPDDFDRFL